MADKRNQAEPVRSQDIRSVKTTQDRDEPVTHTAAAEDGIEPGSEEDEEQSENPE